MAIKMYNCGFGDCFCILDEYVSRPLYVDFGIHLKSLKGQKKKTYENIVNDMKLYEEKDFLLTHYHDDHYSGLIYMIYKMGNKGTAFNDVYIPDVWSYNTSLDVIELLVLSGICCRYGSKRKMNILDFLISICKMNSKVRLTSRGSRIGNGFIALWPDKNEVNNEARQIMQSLQLDDETREYIRGISKKLQGCVNDLVNNNYVNVAIELKTIKAELKGISIGNKLSDDNIKKLNDFENFISIVFHNENNNDKDRNILLTGDVYPESLKIIETGNLSPRILLHGYYDVIKIPHHGTQRHYFSFEKYNNFAGTTNYLFANGDIKNWEIDTHYENDTYKAKACSSISSAYKDWSCRKTLTVNIDSVESDIYKKL